MNRKSRPRINVAISAHGYGHLTQVCAVLLALRALMPIRLRIQCRYDRQVVRDRLGFDDFEYDQCLMDVALVQHDPMQPDLQASYQAYRCFHQSFDNNVDKHARDLQQWKADLVISDISYLAIAAADKAGIPSIAIASLSWDHIVSAYFDINEDEVSGWRQQICEAYCRASLALLPEPAMLPRCFPHQQRIPPLLMEGKRVASLRGDLNIKIEDRRPLVFCSLGGIANDNMPVNAVASDDRFHWIVNAHPQAAPDHVHFYHESVQLWKRGCLSIHDLLASVDAIVGKPGYGMAVEAVAYRLPFVFTRRGHFPDEQPVIAWLHKNGRAHELSQEDWFNGDFGDAILKLLQLSTEKTPDCQGARVAAELIQQVLSESMAPTNDISG